MKKPFFQAKIAIVCDWLTNMGGAEKVIHKFHEMYPQAPIFTTLYNKEKMKGFEKAEIHTSYLQRIPLAKKKHPLFLSLMPMAVESFNLNDYDIVISSSHSVANGIITKPETLHVSYCHTPMRYAWEHWELDYRLRNFPNFLHKRIKKRMHEIRIWDRLSADRVDRFIANSSYIQDRISKYYRKEAEVIHPPVATHSFHSNKSDDFFLMVGRLIGYKRFDLVIEAFNILGKPLKIAGVGPEEKALKSLAKDNVEFLGRVPDLELKDLFSRCKGMIFPQLEDFGITPVEAMASGKPVIAYKAGGALDTVVDGKTGLFFEQQTVDSLLQTLSVFDEQKWKSEEIKQHAFEFSEKAFEERFHTFLQKAYEQHMA